MVLNLTDPTEEDLRARITVFGVGGAGGNAVNNMIEKRLPGVEFVTANTDAQALNHSKASRTIQLGSGVTRGLGAGSKPEVGLRAAEDTVDDLIAALDGAHMCFITAGMGGGTGTGAAPVVARAAREMGILTVGVVTKPFHFEGTRRMAVAEAGVDAMQQVVDTLIVIPNQNLFQVASERTTFVEAFQMADDVLYQGVQGVTDLMVRPGMINLDFADVRSVMEEMGKAMMGTGEADGDTRAIDAAEKAIANPLLDEVSLKGARGVLINITGGYDLTLFEMDEAANRIKEEVDADAMIKFGSAIDPEMEGKMRVSVVATGIDAEHALERPPLEQVTQRRRPVSTDPGLLSAVRAGRRPAEEMPEPVVAREEPEELPVAEPEPMVEDVAVAEESIPAEPEYAPEPAPVVADAPAAAHRPTPEEIRLRAEEVRKRAIEARRQKQIDSAAQSESMLFSIDENSLDRQREPEPQPQPAPVPSIEESLRAHVRNERPAGSGTSRTGLFTINKLIHRVAGHSEPERKPERIEEAEEQNDPSDIPAFLRRQAN